MCLPGEICGSLALGTSVATLSVCRVHKGTALMFKTALKLAAGIALLANATFATAQDSELIKVKMAEVVRSQFYVPMYVALSKGFVKDEGLDVELVTKDGKKA